MRRGTQAAMCPAGRKGGSPDFAVMLVPMLRVTAGGPPGLAASAVLTLSPPLLRAASQVAPEREADEAAEGAAGEEGEDGGAADVLVLLLKGLRQALRDAPFQAPISAPCAVPDCAQTGTRAVLLDMRMRLTATKGSSTGPRKGSTPARCSLLLVASSSPLS